jgi:trk system potassium uptake protein TrkA
MFILIVGAGRVGSSLARAMLKDGHEVSCLDEDPESQARLAVGMERAWEDTGGQFTVGTGLEVDALLAAGIERADAFVAATDGDNTNIVISQIARRRFGVPTVIARVLDPLRAECTSSRGCTRSAPRGSRSRCFRRRSGRRRRSSRCARAREPAAMGRPGGK